MIRYRELHRSEVQYLTLRNCDGEMVCVYVTLPELLE